MSPRSQSLIIFLLLAIAVPLALSAIVPPFGRRGLLVGAYQPIKDLNALEVQNAAIFAINENNEVQGGQLQAGDSKLLLYRRILKGEYQVVEGINYKLVLTANDGSSDGNYEAVVYDKPWEKIKQLVSFKKLLQ